MTVNIDLDPTLRRYCDDFSAKITTLDIIIILLLILSSITHIGSIKKTSKLAKVWVAYCTCTHMYTVFIQIKAGLI